MILCVTLNPCLDKTLTVPRWRPGDSVRGQAVREVVGGKGNNVARALTRLGRRARPVTFLGGPVGTHCHDLLRSDDHLDPLVIATASPTRVILTVRTEDSPDQTAFFDPDPEVLPAEADALFRAVEAALDAAGDRGRHSLRLEPLAGDPRPLQRPDRPDPRAPGPRLPRHLRPRARRDLGAPGPTRSSSTAARRPPTSGRRPPTLTDAHVRALLDDWSRQGVRCGIVTDGPGPVFAKLDGRHYRALPPPIAAVNPIGSGDCLMAGITDAWLSRLDPEPTLRHGIACAVANALVWDAGAIDPSAVRAARSGDPDRASVRGIAHSRD